MRQQDGADKKLSEGLSQLATQAPIHNQHPSSNTALKNPNMCLSGTTGTQNVVNT